jgi:hypothetical protein
MTVKWSDRPREHRWAIVGAFVGMAIGAFAVFHMHLTVPSSIDG